MITRALWLNGTVGAGKTTVGAAVARRLASRGEAVAFVDTDALGDLSPRPPDDPFNTRLVATNLAAVAANFSSAGARSLVVAGVVNSFDEFERYEGAIGVFTLVCLAVSETEVELRLRQRHGEIDTSGLRWHLDRAPTLAASLDASGLPMLDITNAGRPDDTAQAVIVAAGWESSDNQ